MSKFITLSGKQFCGKDTVAKILLDRLPSFHRIGLADAIKLKYSERTGLTLEEINAVMKPENFVGRAPQQVEDFLKDYVEPVLEKNKDLLGIEVEINV